MKFYIDMVFSLCSVSLGNMTMPCTYMCAYTHTPFFGNKSKGKHPTVHNGSLEVFTPAKWRLSTGQREVITSVPVGE